MVERYPRVRHNPEPIDLKGYHPRCGFDIEADSAVGVRVERHAVRVMVQIGTVPNVVDHPQQDLRNPEREHWMVRAAQERAHKLAVKCERLSVHHQKTTKKHFK